MPRSARKLIFSNSFLKEFHNGGIHLHTIANDNGWNGISFDDLEYALKSFRANSGELDRCHG